MTRSDHIWLVKLKMTNITFSNPYTNLYICTVDTADAMTIILLSYFKYKPINLTTIRKRHNCSYITDLLSLLSWSV